MIKRKKHILSLTLLLGVLICNAQDPIYNNSILWKAKKPGNKNTIYVLGTVHLLDKNYIDFPIIQCKKLIAKCKTLCVEVDPNQEKKPKGWNTKYFTKDENLRISKQLNADYFERFMEIVDASNYYLKHYQAEIDSMQPRLLGNYLNIEKQFKYSSSFEQINYLPEFDFIRYAKLLKFELIPLEKLQDHYDYAIRSDFSNEEAFAYLKSSIDNFNVQETVLDVYTLYKQQNLILTEEEYFKDSTMIYRNIGMADKIDSIANKQSVFVAIGGAHLPYATGVLNLLAEKGYSIKPMKVKL